jgi:hypothetical protein
MTAVVAMMLMGRRPEPYLPAVLASLEPAVDAVVLHDNSGDRACENRRALEASTVFQQGRAHVIEAAFHDFATARNQCLEKIRALWPPHDTWIMLADCDDVHTPPLATVTRRVLPRLQADITVADGYFVQFMQSFDFYISVDRRHNMFMRLNDQIGWTSSVHEKVRGLDGVRLCLPYLYGHYGYVRANVHIQEKWLQYHDLGDRSFRRDMLETVPVAQMFIHEVPKTIPFRGQHPPALRVMRLDGLADAEFEAAARAHHAQPRVQWMSRLRAANYRLRLLWRALSAPLVARQPGLWPALLGIASGSAM